MTYIDQYQAVANTNAGRYSTTPVIFRKVADLDGHILYRDLLASGITVYSMYTEKVKHIFIN